MKNLIGQSRSEFVNYLKVYNPLADADSVSLVMVYKQFLAKDQIIYKTLNMFKTSNTFLAGFVWVPTKCKADLQTKLQTLKAKLDVPPIFVEKEPDPELTPPTFFREVEFTNAAQMIIDQYEVPGYKETNPALFTVISFPFLFGVMFGDLFAGSILLSFGLYLCLCNFDPSHPMAGA